MGVLLLGPSGIGKTESALELVTLGHHLIADDVVKVFLQSTSLMAESPASLRNKIHLRDVGIIDLQHIFGAKKKSRKTKIQIVIELAEPPQDQYKWAERRRRPTKKILGVPVPLYQLTVTPMRHLAILIETIVRWERWQSKKGQE